jgi:HEAT repeat protein
MSESEGNRELAGLARSIDALFSGAATSAPADAPILPAEDALVDEAPVEEAFVDESEPSIAAPVPDLPDLPELPELPEPTEDPEGFAEAPADELEPLPEIEAAVPEVELTEETEPVEELPVEAIPPVASASAAEDEEEEPTPLDLAVAAYVEGDLARAEEIETLAASMLEQKEIEPIVRAVATLAHAAGEPRDDSVYAVADAIISPIVLGRLARRMGSERDATRRKEYFLACRNIGSEMAAAIRDDLADSTDRLARRIHYDALIAMGDASRSTIESMAEDENRFLVRNAVAILGEIGGDRATELVVSALANPDARVRREALLSLAKLGDAESGHLVLGLLEDPDAEVRRAAAVAAGELKVERALKTLIKALDSAKDPDEVLPLIRALGQLGDPGAVSSIEKHAVNSMFSKSTTSVRINAYRALNTIGTPHARRLLNKAVSDKDAEVKAAVKDMLNIH